MNKVESSVTLIQVPGDPQKQEQYADRLSLEASQHGLFQRLDEYFAAEEECGDEKRAFFYDLIGLLCDIRLEVHLLRFGEEDLYEQPES